MSRSRERGARRQGTATCGSIPVDSLVESFLPFVRWCVAQRVGWDSDEIDDLVDEVWLRVIATRCADRPDGQIAAWLRAIVRNVCVDAIRDRQRRRRAVEMAAAEAPSHARPPPDESLSRRERMALWSSVGGLPPAERQAIVAHYYFGLSAHEIARRFDRTPGAVRKALSLGRRRLRERLGPAVGDWR